MSWEGRELSAVGRVDGTRMKGSLRLTTGDAQHSFLPGDWELVQLVNPTASTPILPAPSGPYSVGRTTLHWIDAARNERNTPGQPQKRELLVYVWYPSAHGGAKADYLPDAAVVADQLPKGATETIAHLDLPVYADAALVPGIAKLPVVIFSPGKGVKTLLYSALQQDLASHGFLVAAIEHPYDAPVVVFPDGRAVRPLPKDQAVRQPGSDIDAQREEAEYRAEDIEFVKQKLIQLSTEGEGRFANRLDYSRISVVGHSLGGMAAFRACQIDAALQSCINIDGSYRARPYPASVEAGKLGPAFMWLRRPQYLFTDVQLKQIGMSRREFDQELAMGSSVMASVARGGIDVRLPHPGIDHMDFSDVGLLRSDASPTVRAERILTIEMTRAWVRDFLQALDKGGPESVLFARTSAAYREAQVSVYQGSH